MKAINNFWLPRLFSNEYIEGTLAFKGYHGALLSQSIYWSFVAAGNNSFSANKFLQTHN
nr:hypothetical protein [Mycoplasmopsis bovis]